MWMVVFGYVDLNDDYDVDMNCYQHKSDAEKEYQRLKNENENTVEVYISKVKEASFKDKV